MWAAIGKGTIHYQCWVFVWIDSPMAKVSRKNNDHRPSYDQIWVLGFIVPISGKILYCEVHVWGTNYAS